ncbi:Crp/Fnr family transcriptional regulator [Thermospira aquatica]|uniref:Crp/Fnr family transcriptional regulator n=1 Tax=Thermospira aquatica TaxID=2828656 RepID=A0AAX3BC75_9SPIR|nr:Crp/Fnr family transcriptional regulator [Thermospira aquatica]URA09720.1 Crp/Fnr family transcriptional regulator [Thermospira aquatica]
MFLPWHLPLFQGISQEERERIQKLPWHEYTFEKKEIILRSGSEYKHLWIIISGECQAIFPSLVGEVFVVEKLRAPVVLASALLFASSSYLPVDVEAITPGKALYVEKSVWENILGECEILRKNFLREVSDKLLLISKRMMLFQLPVEKRLLLYLSQMKKDSMEIHLPMSIENLAAYLFVTRQALCRVFRRLEKEGYLLQDRRTIRLQPRFLEEFGVKNGE